jgi:dolichol-phosphate mannosyltransferase
MELPSESTILIPELSVVMPAYNEEEALPAVLPEAVAALDSICGEWELIVVDDGSTDGTAEVLRQHSTEDARIRVLTQRGNLGYPMAVRRGFDAARFLVVGTVDADGQFDLRELSLLYPLLRKAHLAVGCRMQRADGWRRRLASSISNLLVRRVLGIKVRDLDCRFRLFRKSLLQMIALTGDRVAFDAEVLARTRETGLKWAEESVSHYPRRAGSSKGVTGSVFSVYRGLRRLRRDL